MPVKQKIPYSNGHFFITFTCYSWLPLIELTNSYDLVYKWFDYLKQQGHFITGYVLMPNHVHATIAFSESGKDIFFATSYHTSQQLSPNEPRAKPGHCVL